MWVSLVLAVLLFAVVILAYWLAERPFRDFGHDLAARQSVSDEEMAARYFEPDLVPHHVPGLVRRVFADQLGYPAEKLLPDDDLASLDEELDVTEFYWELEGAFGIAFPAEDVARMDSTIRTASLLVAEKLRELVSS